jgi:ribosomal protein S18 acetylase RimI-like enzyme
MTESVAIKFANAIDAQNLSSVIRTVIEAIPYYNEIAKSNEIAKYTSDSLIKKISDDQYSVIIASVNGEIAGFCMSEFDHYTIWLEWFGVLEKYRGLGLTALLLVKLEDTMKVRGSHKIWCDCRTDNKASMHILSSKGFKQLVTIYNHWYSQDFILWEKQIV